MKAALGPCIPVFRAVVVKLFSSNYQLFILFLVHGLLFVLRVVWRKLRPAGLSLPMELHGMMTDISLNSFKHKDLKEDAAQGVVASKGKKVCLGCCLCMVNTAV